MKKLIVAAMAMALSAPVWAAPQDPAPQPEGSSEVAGTAASSFSKINTAAWIYGGVAAAAVAYSVAGDSSSDENDTGNDNGSGGTSGTGGTTGTGS